MCSFYASTLIDLWTVPRPSFVPLTESALDQIFNPIYKSKLDCTIVFLIIKPEKMFLTPELFRQHTRFRLRRLIIWKYYSCHPGANIFKCHFSAAIAVIEL